MEYVEVGTAGVGYFSMIFGGKQKKEGLRSIRQRGDWNMTVHDEEAWRHL